MPEEKKKKIKKIKRKGVNNKYEWKTYEEYVADTLTEMSDEDLFGKKQAAKKYLTF